MKKINVRVELTEADLQDFEAVIYSKDDSEDYCWTYMAEDADIEVTIHFTKENNE